MKSSRFKFVILLISSFLIGNIAIAQNESFYTVTTWKVQIPQDGSMAEFSKLLKEFQQKVTQPNPHIASERVMRHLSGSDSRDLVIITEYKSWNAIDAAATKQGELMQNAWGTEEAGKAFFSKLNKYFLMHTDEMYTELPELAKN